MLFEAAKLALLALNRCGARYALCGGLAVGIHGHVRATRDIDLWFDGPEEAEKGAAALVEDGWVPSGEPLPLPDGVVIRRFHRGLGDDLAVVDCLIPPVPPPWTLAREQGELDGCACWVLDRQSLVTLKRWSDRPQDRADLAALADDDA